MKSLIILVLISLLIASCAPSVTMQQAANSNYRGTRSVK